MRNEEIGWNLFWYCIYPSILIDAEVMDVIDVIHQIICVPADYACKGRHERIEDLMKHSVTQSVSITGKAMVGGKGKGKREKGKNDE